MSITCLLPNQGEAPGHLFQLPFGLVIGPITGLEVLVNAYALGWGLQIGRWAGPEAWHDIVVEWRRSLPLTTIPVAVSIYRAGMLSPGVAQSVAIMAASRGLGIFLSDHWLVDARTGRPTTVEQWKWKRAWFVGCAVGAVTEMDVCFALANAGRATTAMS